jgi:hypothetical protein
MRQNVARTGRRPTFCFSRFVFHCGYLIPKNSATSANRLMVAAKARLAAAGLASVEITQTPITGKAFPETGKAFPEKPQTK